MKEHRRESSKFGGGDEGGGDRNERKKSLAKGEGDGLMYPDQAAGVAAWRELCPGVPACLAEGADEAVRQRLMTERMQNLRWRLPMPPRFMPYMEKHRIYDLFYELAVELVVKKPKDHVQFLRHQLVPASYSKDRPRVIIIGPPFFGLTPMAKKLASSLGVPYVPMLKRFHAPNPKQECETSRRPGESLPRYAARVLRTEPLLSGGWVVAGFPRSVGEAELIRRAGVRPTHVLQLVPSVTSKDTCLFSQGCKFTSKEVNAYLEYTRRIRGLREIFMPVLKEVDIRQPSLDDLVRECAERVRDSKEGGPPSIFRVALIGPPGSGTHTQAKLLAQRFNLIIVDAGLEEVRARLDECHERLLDAAGEKLIPNDRVDVVQDRVMQPDCLLFGWVLIGCPRNVVEMRELDRLDTPPNRVLVLDVPTDECRDRLVLRRFNKYTGAEYHLDRDQIPLADRAALAVHPNDSPPLVDKKMNEYTSMLPTLLEYLGDSALALRASGMPADRVFEMVSAAVARRPPPFAPRDPEAPPPAAPPPTPMSQRSSVASLSEPKPTKKPVVSETEETTATAQPEARAVTTSSSARDSSRPVSRPRLSTRLAERSPRRPPTRTCLMAARLGWPYDRKSSTVTHYQRADSGDRSGLPRSSGSGSPDSFRRDSRFSSTRYSQKTISPSLIPQHDTIVNRIVAEDEGRTSKMSSEEAPLRRPSEDDSFTGGPKTSGVRRPDVRPPQRRSTGGERGGGGGGGERGGRERRKRRSRSGSPVEERERRSTSDEGRGARKSSSDPRTTRLSSIDETEAERGTRFSSGDVGPREKTTTRRRSSAKRPEARFSDARASGDTVLGSDGEGAHDDDEYSSASGRGTRGSLPAGKGARARASTSNEVAPKRGTGASTKKSSTSQITTGE